MDWTTFGNIINVLAGLVTVGAPIFSVLKAVVRSKQSNVAPFQASLSQSQRQAPLNKRSHIRPNTIPWYMWVKAIFYTLMHMIEAPVIIFFYFFGGLLLIGVIFVFCFLVGIPVGWLNDSWIGPRVMILCILLIVSLHFSVEFAEHSQELLETQLQEMQKRRKSL